MTLERLKAAKHRTIGTKQTVKALARGQVQVAFIAADAEDRVTRDIRRLAAEKQVQIVMVETMVALGKACGIEVGAAAAAILKE